MRADVDRTVRRFGLAPHPEGGWYRETLRSAFCTTIMYLLPAGQYSAWHRVRGADEVWHHYAGDLLALLTDLRVDLALHGHIHRANAWQLSDGRSSLVIASAGALVNDGRRDASYLEIDIERGRLAVWRRSVTTGRPTLLYEGARSTPR